MPQKKNKQQAFQAAEQGVQEVRDLYNELDETSPEFGTYKKQLKKEINEAQQQIEKAMSIAGERQMDQLEAMKSEMEMLDEEFE